MSKRIPMSNDEIIGRLHTLEHVAMLALGMYLANSKNEAGNSRALALLDQLRKGVVASSGHFPQGAQRAAKAYADHLLSVLEESVRRHLKSEGQTH